MCSTRGRPVGYLDPRKVRADVSLQVHLEEALLSGHPVEVDGCIVGGWGDDGDRGEGDHELQFGLDLGDSPLDADMDDLLELES